MLSHEQLTAYLKRIGFPPEGQEALLANGPSLELLQKIQALQLTSIPYENLSLHWRPIQVDLSKGTPTVAETVTETNTASADDAQAERHQQKPTFLSPPFGLSSEALFHKLVVRCRGEYCLELNSLLGEALQALGFEVVRTKAQIVIEFDRLSERLEREAEGTLSDQDIHTLESFAPAAGWETHQMLLVRIPGTLSLVKQQYLVDVGLAKYSILDPIELMSATNTSSDQVQDQDLSVGRGVMGKEFRLSRAHDQATRGDEDEITNNRWNLSVRTHGSRIWFPYYTFLAQEADVTELDMIHYYMSRTTTSTTSTSPTEPFATMPMRMSLVRSDRDADADGDGDSGDDELAGGQVSLQGMRLTIERWHSKKREYEKELVEAKDEGEQREFFRTHFGIEGYTEGAVLVLAKDEENTIDSW
ncbi:N-terminal acetyltransferase [Mortierella sp. AD031]|nr:N-terminal acetyltransferase [Mortierella sp. AD031]